MTQKLRHDRCERTSVDSQQYRLTQIRPTDSAWSRVLRRGNITLTDTSRCERLSLAGFARYRIGAPPTWSLITNHPKLLFALVLTLLLALPMDAWPTAPAAGTVPLVDHHQHLLSPQSALLINTPITPSDVPAAVSGLLAKHEAGWNDAAALAPLYAENAVAHDYFSSEWIKDRGPVAEFVSTTFGSPYRILPLKWHSEGDDAGYLSAIFSRGEGVDRKNVGSVVMRVLREADTWRIAMQYPVFPGAALEPALDADRLVGLLDAAGISRAVVLSIAYWYQAPRFGFPDGVERAREENRWTAAQVALHPDRLVAFCSLNPISDAALELLAECAKDGRFKGLKLHFANGNVDLLKVDHLARVRAVFKAANSAGLAIVAHARGAGDYDARHARLFISDLLTAAPDIPVQIAHLWGGGQFAPEALAVFAEAIEAGDPATRRLIFDSSDAAFQAAKAEAELMVRRMRQIGLDRIYYGSDGAFDGHPDPKASWEALRTGLPFTEAEFAQITANVAPYLRKE